jgi:predicted amidohydrolase
LLERALHRLELCRRAGRRSSTPCEATDHEIARSRARSGRSLRRAAARWGTLRAMRLALAQSTPIPVDIVANLETAERTIAVAADRGAELTAFPELSLTGYELRGIAETPAVWLSAGDPRLDGVRRICAATRTAAILGAPWHDRERQPRLAAIIVTADGDVHASGKQYLHGQLESELFVADRPAPPFVVGGWRVAVAVCFDAAHPAHAAEAAAASSDLYVGSALYEAGQERRSDLHFGARAMDHRMFAALANYAGASGGYTSCGGSGVWSPTGDVLRRAPGNDQALLIVDLDRGELDRFRSRDAA